MAVYGYDHHGHGESEPKEAGERALVHDFNHLVSPLARLCSVQSSGMRIPLQVVPCLVQPCHTHISLCLLASQKVQVSSG